VDDGLLCEANTSSPNELKQNVDRYIHIFHFSLSAFELVNRYCADNDEADHDLLHEIVRASHG